jgi:hypothetical protein
MFPCALPRSQMFSTFLAGLILCELWSDVEHWFLSCRTANVFWWLAWQLFSVVILVWGQLIIYLLLFVNWECFQWENTLLLYLTSFVMNTYVPCLVYFVFSTLLCAQFWTGIILFSSRWQNRRRLRTCRRVLTCCTSRPRRRRVCATMTSA